MSRVLCWEGGMMWDNRIARAVRFSLWGHSLSAGILCHMLDTWHFCFAPEVWRADRNMRVLHLTEVFLRLWLCVGKHKLTWLDQCSGSRAVQSPGRAVLGCLTGHVGRQAGTVWPPGRADTPFRVEMPLLQPAGSRISQEDSHLLMTCCYRDHLCTPWFCCHLAWFMASHMLLQQK